MRDLKIKTPESMKEYNEVFLDRIHNAKLLFNTLPHALSKSGASDVCLKVGGEFRTVYDEAMRQLGIIGWGPEMKQTIQDALVVYRQYLLDSLENKLEETAEWETTEENDYVPHCSACGGAADIDGYEATVRGKIRYVQAEKCPSCGRVMTNAC